MALSVVNNLPSLTAQLALNNTTTALNSSLQKLSTGLRINSGADDPAGLVVSNEQKAQIAGLNQAITNTSEAVNLVQTGEGALQEISTLLDQARSLALSAANTGVTDSTAAAADEAQYSNIISTINTIANTTQFGNTKLLNGTAGLSVTSTNVSSTAYSVGGTSNAPSGQYSLSSVTKATASNVTGTTTYGTSGVYTTTSAAETITINGQQVALGASGTAYTASQFAALVNSVSSASGVTAGVSSGDLYFYNNNYSPAAINITLNDGSGSAIANTLATGIGFTSAAATAQFTLNTGGIATLNSGGSTNANGYVTGHAAQLTLTNVANNSITGTASGTVAAGNVVTFTGLTGVSAALNGLTLTLGAGANPYTSNGSATDTLDIQNNALTFQTGANENQTATVSFGSVLATALGTGATVTNAAYTNLQNVTLDTTASDDTDAVSVIDQAIKQISSEAGSLGAFQSNTLQANAVNLQAALQNTTGAESTVTDTNFASEIANFTQLQVQQQAGASVLGVANQLPATIANLLSKL